MRRFRYIYFFFPFVSINERPFLEDTLTLKYPRAIILIPPDAEKVPLKIFKKIMLIPEVKYYRRLEETLTLRKYIKGGA